MNEDSICKYCSREKWYTQHEFQGSSLSDRDNLVRFWFSCFQSILVTIHTFVGFNFFHFLYPIIDSISASTTSITTTIPIITGKKWKSYIINETQQMPATLYEQQKSLTFLAWYRYFNKRAEVKLVLQFQTSLLSEMTRWCKSFAHVSNI